MIKKIIFTKRELTKLKKLAETCHKTDNYSAKIYWNIVENRLTPGESDYFYLENNQIVGYLGWFMFKRDEVELSALVHPQFRRKKIFTRLFNRAIDDIKSHNIPTCFCLCPNSSEAAINFMKTKQAILDHAEYIMRYQGSGSALETSNPENLEMRIAEKADIINLVNVHVKGFPEDTFDETSNRFYEGLKQNNRKIWILTQHGIEIGKVHIRWDQDKPFLHDVCIIPEYQKKNYGSWMMAQVVNWLKSQGNNKIYLEVFAHNSPAVRLYEKCGFIITDHYQYWRLDLFKN